MKCKMCRGKGWYSYDENHSRPCEFCCPHDQGWWDLTPMHARYEQGKDNGCCKRGCGTLRRDLKTKDKT